MKICDDLKNEDYTQEEKEHWQRIHNLVEHEIDAMDMEGLIDYVTDKLFDYFGDKSEDEIKELYKEEILDYED